MNLHSTNVEAISRTYFHIRFVLRVFYMPNHGQFLALPNFHHDFNKSTIQNENKPEKKNTNQIQNEKKKRVPFHWLFSYETEK